MSKRKRLLKELRDLDRGSSVAYDMAIYDRGAAVKRLEAKKAKLVAELKKLGV